MRILWVHIENSSLWAALENKNRCISVHRRIKAFNFDYFVNLHNSFLLPEYFIDYFCENGFHVSCCDIRLVFTFPPKDSTLQYKKCVHFWNNFPFITSMRLAIKTSLYNRKETPVTTSALCNLINHLIGYYCNCLVKPCRSRIASRSVSVNRRILIRKISIQDLF